MPRLVVLGTGTDVGKTYVSRLLAELIQENYPNARVLALKPIESGVSSIQESDAFLLASCSRPPTTPRLAFAFRDAVSPHLAAKREHRTLQAADIRSWVNSREDEHSRQSAHLAPSSWTIVETAGGALTPINKEQTNTTVAIELQPAVLVLVALDRLGVLHELRATILALETLSVRPTLVILNAPLENDPSTGTNRAEAEELQLTKIHAKVGRHARFTLSDSEEILRILSVAEPNATRVPSV